jgi:hypothetical protein
VPAAISIHDTRFAASCICFPHITRTSISKRDPRSLTLVEEEVVDEVRLPSGGTRRQLTVRGVRLNELIGKRFRVGEVECYGVAP